MPVSRSGGWIFVHIPKTAGTSVLQTLGASGVDFDGIGLWDIFLHHPLNAELVDRYRKTFRVGTLARAPQQHLPAQVLRELTGLALWERSFKFAFVRNPWDLLVSGYHYQTQTLDETQRMLNPDVYAVLERCRDFSDVVRYYPMIRADQMSFLTDESGSVIVDFIGRYESIEKDFAHVCERIGIDVPLPHENRSEHASYRQYYTPETREIVARHFARDIERFGYTF